MRVKLTLMIADANKKECATFKSLCETIEEIDLIGCVHCGEDAVARLKGNDVDVLLLDPVLPGLDGLGVLDEIRDMKDIHQPAVFICSSLMEDRLLYKLQQRGVVYCFIKPINELRVLSRIVELMCLSSAEFLYRHTPEQLEAEVNPPSEDRIQNEITRQIRAVGVPAHLKGYHYLRHAIYLAVATDKSSQMLITKEIYPVVATQFKTKPSLVERAIRNAIEVAWLRGNTDVLNEFFGYTINDKKGKPTNAEFVAMIADRVKMRLG